MKKIILAALAVLVFYAGSAIAGSESYIVVKGDTLSGIAQKYGVNWKEVAQENNLANPNLIFPGQRIQVKAGPKRGTLENPSLYTEDEVGDDPYKGSLREALELFEKIEKGEKFQVRRLPGDEGWDTLRNGEIIQMVSGRRKVGYFIVALKDGRELALEKYIVTHANGSEFPVWRNPWCGNWLIKIPQPVPPPEEEVPVPPVPAPPELIQPPVGEEPPPVTIVPGIPAEEIPPVEMLPCPTCRPELEIDAGVAVWVHDPHGDGGTTGKNLYAQIMYWENFEADCSSEYWYGLGGLGSYYNYGASHFLSKGNGWRAAGQGGLKRNYAEMGKDGIELERSWQVKARLGWEESEWKNHQLKIERRGPAYGPYAEYNHELIDEKLKLVAQVEGWMGKFDSQTFVGAFVGLDWKFANRFTLRAGPGLDYQGWDQLYAFAPQAQIMYDLPNRNGRLAIGAYGKIYTHIGPTLGSLGRYESKDLIKKVYGQSRRREYKPAGVGIGGNGSFQLEVKKEKSAFVIHTANFSEEVLDNPVGLATLNVQTTFDQEASELDWSDDM